jgi:FixJ family two-component response regulator
MNFFDYTLPRSYSRTLPATPIVFVVDDDVSVRESLELLIRCAGWQPKISASAEEFLARPRVFTPSCLLLDVNLPNINGLDLQRLIADRQELPIIIITGYGDIPMSVQAMKAGAVDFLTKPFMPEVLLNSIRSAVKRSRVCVDEEANLQALRNRHRSLSRREQEVMALVVRGQLNKQVSGELGISEITVKQHRGRMMRKMRARSLPELVTIAIRLGLVTAGNSEYSSAWP